MQSPRQSLQMGLNTMCESGQIECMGFVAEVIKSICLCTRGPKLDFPLLKIACIK